MPTTKRSSSTSSLLDMAAIEKPKLKVLMASTIISGFSIAREVTDKLCTMPSLSVQAILSMRDGDWQWMPDSRQLNEGAHANASGSGSCMVYTPVAKEDIEQRAAELITWADLLLLAPIDANSLAKMLHGFTDNLLLEILRDWDVSKKVLMVPGMSLFAWENPMTKKQLNKIKRQWAWIRVMQPLLWQYEGKKTSLSWNGMEELLEAINISVDLASIGQGVEVIINAGASQHPLQRTSKMLPPEIWSMIFDYVGDWEMAKALHIFTHLPTPPEWQVSSVPLPPTAMAMFDFSWTVLRGSLQDVAAHLKSIDPPLKYLPPSCVKLILKFGLVPLLSYLSTHEPDLFRITFGHTLLPTKASAIFPRLEILEFWRTSPFYLNKEYTAEAVDGASKMGFVSVLQWWRQSGLTMKYTESALEQASARGHIAVLDWWKRASTTPPESPLPLKVGKSICYAAQFGQADVIRWWDQSSIAYSHEESIPKLASAHGHVNVLTAWKALKGEKMIYDNQVLVGPTKNGHPEVLQWWKTSGFRVEYKTCDIEEALEDNVGNNEDEIRKWWARNGLNLGVGTSEWMKTKVL